MFILLKTRDDFQTEDEYRAYTKTSDFLLKYSWKGKTREQIIFDMALPDYEIKQLDQAMEIMKRQDNYLAIDLDRLIMWFHQNKVMERE